MSCPEPAPDPIKDPLIGAVIDGTTELLQLIGRGGSGSVYRGRHLVMDRQCAVKIIHLRFESDHGAVKRFQREARILSSLDHPGLVQVFACGIMDDKMPYMVMELLSGETLRERLDRERSLPIVEAVPIFQELCQALAYAHGQGLIHRDVKPANVFLVKDASGKQMAKILDFGIAKVMTQSQETLKVTATGHLIGSPAYMSPEQCQGVDLDPRSDVYSLGCLMYECLSGSPPFSGESPLEVLYKQVHDSIRDTISLPDGSQVSPLLARTIHKALAKDPAQRFQTIEEMEQALALIASDPRATMPARRSRWSALVKRQTARVAACLVLLLAVAAAVVWRLDINKQERVRQAQDATSINALRMAASDLHTMGRATDALPKLEKALKLASAGEQRKSQELAYIHVEMTLQYQELRQYQKALEHLQAAFANLPDTMRSSDLAHGIYGIAMSVFANVGDMKSARICADRALEIELRQKGMPAAECMAYIWRADNYRGLGEVDKADRLYDRVEKIIANNADISDQLWARLLKSRALQAQSRNHPSLHERLLLQAHAACAEAGDCDFLREKDLCFDLASHYHTQCRLSESQAWLDKMFLSLAKEDAALPDSPLEYNRSQLEYANLWRMHGLNSLGQSQLNESKGDFQKCLAAARQANADESPFTSFEGLEGLSVCAFLQNDEKLACRLWLQAVDALKRSKRPNDKVTLNLYMSAASFLNAYGREKDGLALILYAVKLSKLVPIGNRELANLYVCVSALYAANGRQKEAEDSDQVASSYGKAADKERVKLIKELQAASKALPALP